MLAFLEMTFVFVTLALLHSQRKLLGQASFYFCAGVLFVFAQFVAASNLQVIGGFTGFDFYIGSTVLTLPFLAALLLIYITEGTLAAQRLIIACLAALGLFVYLVYLTTIQCNWLGFAISQGNSADTLSILLTHTRRTMSGSVLALVADLFLLPIFYQRLRNVGCRTAFCVLGAMVFAQIIDSFVYMFVARGIHEFWWLEFNNSLIIKSIATAWLSGLVSIYLFYIEKGTDERGRRALDIFFAFFGSYGKAQALERNLREWEGRYKLLVENASEMIMLVSSAGIILEANRAAARLIAKTGKTLVGEELLDKLEDEYGKPLGQSIFELPPSEHPSKRIRCFVISSDGEKVYLDMVIAEIRLEDVSMYIVQGRDITEESRLAREKELLSEQLDHSQRLDSIGKLAGGVAHDFNNHIHAILGHLDLIRLYSKNEDPKVTRHLEKITQISEQAGRLTHQLLGFARKGKYHEENLDLRELLKYSTELFLPNSQKNMVMELKLPPEPMMVRGDLLQLQQVFINFMINARDAMENNPEEKGMLLKITAGEAVEVKVTEKEAHGMIMPAGRREDYYAVAISDNGSGMSPEVVARVFEPFFTTKPYGKGTGMGLAMIYGTITNHLGWIQFTTSDGEGTTFYVFLPKLSQLTSIPRPRGKSEKTV